MTTQHPGLFHGHPGEYVTPSDIAEEIYTNLITNSYPDKLTKDQLRSPNYFDHISYRLQELDDDYPDMFFDELCLTLGNLSGNEIYPKVIKPHIVRVRKYTKEQWAAYREGLKEARKNNSKEQEEAMLAVYDSYLFHKEEIIDCIVEWLQEYQRGQFFKFWQNSLHEKRIEQQNTL